MKAEDFGFDPKTGHHDARLTTAENRFLGILWNDYAGAANKISADELAIRFDMALKEWEIDGVDLDKLMRQIRLHPHLIAQRKRDVRRMHNHLLERHDNVPILSKAGADGGYWIAAGEDECAVFYDTFRRRGMTGLKKASRGRKAILVDMMRQLTFEFEELVDPVGIDLPPRRMAGMPAPIEVVDAFIERMLQNPEKFADGLRKIGQKYGSVLLPRGQAEAIKAKASELLEAVASLGV